MPDDSLVGDAVAVCVGQPEDLRSSGDKDRALVPETALEHHQIVSKDRATIVPAITIDILEPQYPVAGLVLLFNKRRVRTA